MFGIQTILSAGWEHDELYVPPGFLRNAWNLFLPQGSLSVLLSTMSYILQGLSKEEVIEQMKEEEEELQLKPFSFSAEDLPGEWDEATYQEMLNREKEVRRVLERSSLQYPTTIQEWLDLLIQVGIIIEVHYKGKQYLDLVVEPYPFPEQALKLTKHELDNMIMHRQLLAESS